MTAPIQSRDDIQQLVYRFYDKVRQDPQLGFIFEEVAHIDWDKHLPRMVDFWENIVWGTGNYKGQPMAVHMMLTRKHPLTAEHFNRWKELFYETIDDLFTGEIADELKMRAHAIAGVMEMKVKHVSLMSLNE